MSKHLVVCISAHGFGHIGQAAPVVNELRRRFPDLLVTVRSSAPVFKLRERFGVDTRIHSVPTDIGVIQANAVEVLHQETALAYARFHQDWAERVDDEAKALEALRPDLLLSNVPYLPLAGARRAGIPAVAMCSLNWGDIYAHYFRTTRSEAAAILEQIYAAYDAADVFLQPEPSMPMPALNRHRPIGPLAELGRSRRVELLDRLGLSATGRVVLVSLGGMELRLPVEDWALPSWVRFVVPGSWGVRHPQVVHLEDLSMPYLDVLRSCDGLVTKPGYGSFVEAACAGVAIVYLERPDWPEAPYLTTWLQAHARCRPASQESLRRGDIVSLLEQAWQEPPMPAPTPSGVDMAATYLTQRLFSGSD